MSEWIRTSERVPEDGQRVLCVVDRIDPGADRVFILERDPMNDTDRYPWKSGSCWFTAKQVTHWMPLPPLPTDADDGGTT